MKLSIVIPAYNEEKSLGKCLDSVFKDLKNVKSDVDVEVIVVNNNSMDKTRDVALLYPSVIIVDEPKKGLSQARHSGFMASKGELIANIDADTILTENWINKVIEQFSKNENLVALSGPFIYYDLSCYHRVAVRLFYYVGFMIHIINHYLLRVGSILQGGNFILKRSALEEINGYNTEFEFYGEDTDIARRIQKLGEVKFTFKLPILTSGRRLKAEGMLKIGIRYTINYFWTTFLNKPFTKKYLDIRIDN